MYVLTVVDKPEISNLGKIYRMSTADHAADSGTKSQPIPSLLFSIVRKYTCIYYYRSSYWKVSKYGKMQRFKSNIYFSRINSKKFPIGVYAVIFHSTACKELLAYVISIFQSFHSKSMQYNRENNLLLTWLNRWHWSPFWKNLCILLIAEKVGPRARQIFYKRYFILSAVSIRVHETSRVEVPCECRCGQWAPSIQPGVVFPIRIIVVTPIIDLCDRYRHNRCALPLVTLQNEMFHLGPNCFALLLLPRS